MGLTFAAYTLMIVAIFWSMLWFWGIGDALQDSNIFISFLLFVSFYWVHQVLTNIMHVTTAGTVGTWWFVPEEAQSCWSPAIQDSLIRATSFSFGSICLGSLMVAIVQGLRGVAHMARDTEDFQALVCILDCLLGCVEDMIEYLNKWAYVYVGLYGLPYFDAGKSVMQLFEHKGWSVIITDDLTDNVLFMISVGVAMLVGLVGFAVTTADPYLLASMGLGSSTGFL